MRFLLGSEFGDGFVLDLADSFTGEVEFFTNVFEAQWMVNANSEEIAYYFFLALG